MFTCKNGHTFALPKIVGSFKPIVCWECVAKK